MKLFYFIFILNFLFIGFTCAQSSVVLNWVDTSNTETGFGIERALNSGNFSYLNGVLTNVQTYTDSTVQNSNTYSYRLYAWNSYGNSSYSNSITISINSQGQGTSASSGSGGGSSGGVSVSASSSGGLIASVIPNQDNKTNSENFGENSITGNSVNSNNENTINSKNIAGRVVDGDFKALTELSPLAVYSTLGLLIGIVFFIVVWKKMENK